MSDSKEERPRVFLPCKFRRKVNGLYMCYAIGCATVGDMMCECYGCDGTNCSKRNEVESLRNRARVLIDANAVKV